jgi:hypothetical protein
MCNSQAQKLGLEIEFTMYTIKVSTSQLEAIEPGHFATVGVLKIHVALPPWCKR